MALIEKNLVQFGLIIMRKNVFPNLVFHLIILTKNGFVAIQAFLLKNRLDQTGRSVTRL
jgi:hypothetical protein